MTVFTDSTPRMGTLARKKVPGEAPPPASKAAPSPPAASPIDPPTPTPQLSESRRGPKPGHSNRPPNPTCCFKPTKRKSIGSGICVCTICGKEFDTRKAVDAAARTVVIELPAPAPGLNGDHATRLEERSKIPPSRPANNSRGGLTWKRVKDAPLPPCKVANKPKRNELTEDILALGDPPDHVVVEGMDDKARRRMAASLRRRAGAGKFTSYIVADGSAAVFHRTAKGEGSR